MLLELINGLFAGFAHGQAPMELEQLLAVLR